jgi:hypothetical protein
MIGLTPLKQHSKRELILGEYFDTSLINHKGVFIPKTPTLL